MSASGRRPRRQDAEDDSLSSIAREAEARLAAKRAARAEAREIRLKELEKQQREVKLLRDKLKMRYRVALGENDKHRGHGLVGKE